MHYYYYNYYYFMYQWYGMELTFSGNQGVTNGIWNVFEYECNVSNESGDTAPSIE